MNGARISLDYHSLFQTKNPCLTHILTYISSVSTVLASKEMRTVIIVPYGFVIFISRHVPTFYGLKRNEYRRQNNIWTYTKQMKFWHPTHTLNVSFLSSFPSFVINVECFCSSQTNSKEPIFVKVEANVTRYVGKIHPNLMPILSNKRFLLTYLHTL